MSNTTITKSGNPAPSLATVATDQTTIRGSGTAEDPLRVVNGGSSPIDVVVAGTGTVPRCTPVKYNGSADREVAAVALGGFAVPIVCGLLVKSAIGANRANEIRDAGIFEATTEDWDAVTLGTGGLTPGAVYYLGFTISGVVTTTRTAASHESIVQLGIAISPTKMQLQLAGAQVNP